MFMSKILLIETSTALCSAALEEDGKVTAYLEEGGRAHASRLAPMIKEIMDGRGLALKELDAVCVSKGPGSYTGLRVGASTAKGLCFGAGIPLLAVGSLDALVWGALADGSSDGCKFIVPMIDARRMEVYTAVFDASGRQLTPTEAKVVEPGSFAEELAAGNVLFIGDGAEKCRDMLGCEGARFVGRSPDARGMAAPAEALLKDGKTENVAYFEPFYLKDFTATVSRKKLF